MDEVTLESGDAAVSILNYGCVLRDWRVDGARGSVPVTLGFPRFEDYALHSQSHGIIAGRVANRTAGARFEMDGREYRLTPNHGSNHLHGGAVGLGRRIWEMETDDAGNAVHLLYASPDGEEGYPGAVDFEVTFRLEGARLICAMSGVPDRPTPVNLAQHSYYNLGGGGDVLDHEVEIAASRYTPTGPDLIPDGTIAPVAGTRMDFTTARSLGDSDPGRLGLDHNLVLDADRDRKAPAARVSCPRTGLNLRLWTDEPALQIYNGSDKSVAVPGHDGRKYGPYAGLCLEAQHYPDSLNRPDWPSIIATSEEPYNQQLMVEISP